MQVIGVVDLLDGRAVHARGGQRERYLPVQAVDGAPIEPGEATALARMYVERLGVSGLYVADLDAIAGRPLQNACIAALATGLSATTASDPAPHSRPENRKSLEASPLARAKHATSALPLWLDAGVSSLERARQVVGLGAAHLVVGLETLHSYQALAQICGTLGDRVAFSLDLREGEPIVAADGIASGEPPHVVAARAADTGVGAIIVIDLARVGASAGLDLELIARVRTAAPGLMLVAGGGVHGPEDLTRLADEGCDGALVATALLEGRIRAADVAAARQFNRRFDR
ncbi:MAG: HisA/HisF-related TIM barrel protein [Acidobacteriota bacterium]